MSTSWWWSWLLTAVGLLGLFLAGRKDWRGWAVGLAAQLLWVIYAIASHQYGFLVSAVCYGAIYYVNLIRWLREPDDRTHPRGPADDAEVP